MAEPSTDFPFWWRMLEYYAPGFGGGAPPAWDPGDTAPANTSIYEVGPTTCFTDAGLTTPAGIGDPVEAVVDRLGALTPMVRGVNDGGLAMPTLEQDIDGNYYLQHTAGQGRLMVDRPPTWTGKPGPHELVVVGSRGTNSNFFMAGFRRVGGGSYWMAIAPTVPGVRSRWGGAAFTPAPLPAIDAKTYHRMTINTPVPGGDIVYKVNSDPEGTEVGGVGGDVTTSNRQCINTGAADGALSVGTGRVYYVQASPGATYDATYKANLDAWIQAKYGTP